MKDGVYFSNSSLFNREQWSKMQTIRVIDYGRGNNSRHWLSHYYILSTVLSDLHLNLTTTLCNSNYSYIYSCNNECKIQWGWITCLKWHSKSQVITLPKYSSFNINAVNHMYTMLPGLYGKKIRYLASRKLAL